MAGVRYCVVASTSLERRWSDGVDGFEDRLPGDRLHHVDMSILLRVRPLPRKEKRYDDATRAYEGSTAHAP